jgi:hypothetical protein
LSHVPQAGENFTVLYDFVVGDMANRKGDSISFEYSNPPLDFATITKFIVRWQMPSDASLVQGLNPAPASQQDGYATWEFDNLGVSQTINVQVVVSASAYPDVKEIQAPVQQPQSQPSGGQEQSSGGPSAAEVFFWVILGIAGLALLIAGICWLIDNASDSDSSDTEDAPVYHHMGTYHDTTYVPPSSTWSPSHDSTPTYTHHSPPSDSSPSTHGGGDSGYSGRVSSCATPSCAFHPSCACACACAASAGRMVCTAMHCITVGVDAVKHLVGAG